MVSNLIAVFKTRLRGNSIRVPREILRMLGYTDTTELIVIISDDRIVIRPYRESIQNVEGHIKWLKKNAPECFSEEKTVVRSKWVSIDWMKRKLGLKQ